MSNGHWRVGAALAGLALLYVVLGTGAFFGALKAPYYGYQQSDPAYRAADPEQGNPSQIDRDRAGLPYFAERIASGPDPQDTAEREKRDLAAQESMSVWAFWMLLASAAGVVTTMLGTGFLLWQIMLTREAVKDTGDATEAMVKANEIAETAQRPWISIQGLEAKVMIVQPVPNLCRMDIEFTVALRNSGQSVARNGHLTWQVFPPAHEEAIAAFMDKAAAERGNERTYVAPQNTDTFDRVAPFTFRFEPQTKTTPYLYLAISMSYEGTVEGIRHQTVAVYGVSKANRGMVSYPFDIPDHRAKPLELTATIERSTKHGRMT